MIVSDCARLPHRPCLRVRPVAFRDGRSDGRGLRHGEIAVRGLGDQMKVVLGLRAVRTEPRRAWRGFRSRRSHGLEGGGGPLRSSPKETELGHAGGPPLAGITPKPYKDAEKAWG
jgi:hypothetical protein